MPAQLIQKPKLMKKWPEWAWVCRHAEQSYKDHIYIKDCNIMHTENLSYCSRSWTPEDYVNHRIKILEDMKKDVDKLIEIFTEGEEWSI